MLRIMAAVAALIAFIGHASTWDLPMRYDANPFYIPLFPEPPILFGDYTSLAMTARVTPGADPHNRGFEMFRARDGVLRCPYGELVIRIVGTDYPQTTTINCE